MNCSQVRRFFSAYWDDELTLAEREAVEGHFGRCDRCREQYDRLARVLEAAASLPRVEPDPEFEQRVLARVRHRERAPDLLPVTRPAFLVPVAAAAALALAAILGYQLGSAPRADRARLASAAPSGASVAGTAGAPAASLRAAPVTMTQAPSSTSEGDRLAARAGSEGSGSLDSIFDHSEDVEFILDPVALYKGRPRPVTVTTPTQGQGEKVMITF